MTAIKRKCDVHINLRDNCSGIFLGAFECLESVIDVYVKFTDVQNRNKKVESWLVLSDMAISCRIKGGIGDSLVGFWEKIKEG